MSIRGQGKVDGKMKKMIPVNKSGWVDVSEKSQRGSSSLTACQKIWQLLMDIPMSFMRQPISAIEVKKGRSKVRQNMSLHHSFR